MGVNCRCNLFLPTLLIEEVVDPANDAPVLDAVDETADVAAASLPLRAKDRPASAPPNPARVTRMIDSSVEKYGSSSLLVASGGVGIDIVGGVVSIIFNGSHGEYGECD